MNSSNPSVSAASVSGKVQNQLPRTAVSPPGYAISSDLLEICSVHVGDTLFGIPIHSIVEIVGRALPQPVPLAPAFIGGLMHYRGDVLTTVSLRQLLGENRNDHCQNRDSSGNQDVLVLESGDGCFGLLVDSVGEVLTVSIDLYEPNPCQLDERRRALFAGTYKLDGALLVMLDPEKLDPVRLNSSQGALGLHPEQLEFENSFEYAED